MESAISEADKASQTCENNNSLDDIFGSSPDDHHDNLEDYWKTHEGTEEFRYSTYSAATAEPSDLPSLRRQHVTAGYRDGIAFSKSEHVQRGFDGGYPVGAQIGLRVGTVLGILEGLLAGLESKASQKGPVKKRIGSSKRDEDHENEVVDQRKKNELDEIRALYKRAMQELNIEGLFGGLGANEADRKDEQGVPQVEAGEKNPEDRLRDTAELVIARWEKLTNVTMWEESMEAVESMEDLAAKES